jgi:hypothetical protein
MIAPEPFIPLEDYIYHSSAPSKAKNEDQLQFGIVAKDILSNSSSSELCKTESSPSLLSSSVENDLEFDNNQSRFNDTSSRLIVESNSFEIDDHFDPDKWGWFNDDLEHEQDCRIIRDAWLAVTEKYNATSENESLVVDESQLSTTSDISISSSSSSKKTFVILFQWRNPNPSVATRLFAGDPLVSLPPGLGMTISCCISGFRIVQRDSGEVRAEFQFIFCYGSRSYNCWKSHGDFKALYEIVKHAHKTTEPIFFNTLDQWKLLRQKQKWYNKFLPF